MLKLLRLAYGVMLVAVLFVPFGLYHTMTEPYVSGALWGFMLPVGYVAAASGVALILYPRSKLLQKVGFGYLLILIGVFMMFSLFAFPKEFSINLIQGTNFGYGWVDVDYAILSGAVFWLSLFGIIAGIEVNARKVFGTRFTS